MNSAFRIKTTLYLEISSEQCYPILPAGRIVPAAWQQTFTTFVENQRSIDLHLLRGSSERIAENTSVGKWRIGGITPAPQGQHRILVEIRVGTDGSVSLRAVLDERTLPVILLTQDFPKIPLTFRVPVIPPEKAISVPCPACAHRFVIRQANWKNEPFALCLDCGHEFEPPEEQSLPEDDLPEELVQTLGIETSHRPGGLDAAELRELQEKGLEIPSLDGVEPRIQIGKVLENLPQMMFASSGGREADLNVDEILRQAGDPLPEEQRRKCPNCDAVISRDARRCEWCGQEL